MSTQTTTQTDKWEAFDNLSPFQQQQIDEMAREDFGITLHSGSSAEEIARFIGIYKNTSW